MAIDKCYILMYFCVFPRLYTITFLQPLLSLSEGESRHQLEGRTTGYLQLFAWFNQA